MVKHSSKFLASEEKATTDIRRKVLFKQVSSEICAE